MTALRSLLASALCLLALAGTATAQTSSPAASTPKSKSITTGLTFQALTFTQPPRSLEIQNNNTSASENCWVLVGGPWVAGDTTSSSRTIDGASITSVKDAWLLQPGGSFTRYYPLIPSDPILVTCTSTGDSVAVRVQ